MQDRTLVCPLSRYLGRKHGGIRGLDTTLTLPVMLVVTGAGQGDHSCKDSVTSLPGRRTRRPGRQMQLEEGEVLNQVFERKRGISTMEYYSAIKTDNIMPSAATWMLLENVLLSEVSQKEKEKYHVRSLICGI
ncbi:LINE-1 retrotransposable element ORF2 protein [Camelus dromedarius]|uniref:LINE-1 retrotransposable element ORF2 protein n=1 Tax=Camelus dromedarius TaxID=9838 RepID=A0A5N4CFE4_CAMDR|nr:LINE-1 retrotransposable element ORF2 protein [Camelus dromedarius]